MLCTSLVEKSCEYKQNCLCKLETVTEVFALRVAFKLIEWVYSFFNLCISSRISDWVFVCITSQLKVHWACTSFVLSTSYSGVDLAFWSLHIWFCECSAAWISSACFHCALLLSRFVLSCQICLWWFLSLPSFSSECCSTRTVICMGKKWFTVKARTTWISHMDVRVWIPGPWEWAVCNAKNFDWNFR